GVNTNIAFLIDVIAHADFTAGKTYTDFIPKFFKDWKPRRERQDLALACAEYRRAHATSFGAGPRAAKGRGYEPWKETGPFEIGAGA
ncbi:MAG: acetyl-CoA carboxylase biotin carboxylase subunit, partial [Deltaproteobacteria bacterium]|nr:acetyl-CoA carboxylase biotin carboxylase subunit [Deltaproteobacteria bacterium]